MNIVIILWNHVYHIVHLEKQVTIDLCLPKFYSKYAISYLTINIISLIYA